MTRTKKKQITKKNYFKNLKRKGKILSYLLFENIYKIIVILNIFYFQKKKSILYYEYNLMLKKKIIMFLMIEVFYIFVFLCMCTLFWNRSTRILNISGSKLEHIIVGTFRKSFFKFLL